MSLNFKISQSLEWCARISKLREHPRDSPVFLLHDNEWFFRFIHWENRFGAMFCGICLLLKNQSKDLKPTSVSFRVGFRNEQTLSLGKGEFILNSNSYKVWYMALDDERMPKKSSIHTKDYWIKFLFSFNDVIEPRVKITKETGE